MNNAHKQLQVVLLCYLDCRQTKQLKLLELEAWQCAKYQTKDTKKNITPIKILA